MVKLDGATVVITGGATGIGLALARAMGRQGARPILFEPRVAILDAAVADLQSDGIDAAGLAGDVTDPAQVEALAHFAWNRNGRADILINNAGVGGPRKGILTTDIAAERALFEVNFWGMWHGIQAFGRRYIADGQPAAIYCTGSENSLFPAIPFGGGGYIASKHAILGLMDALRKEAPATITTGIIIPGWVATDLARNMGMDAAEFAARIVPQIAAGAPYCVAHSYNMVRIAERQAEIAAAYAAHAPRHDGDDMYDVQIAVARMKAAQRSDQPQ